MLGGADEDDDEDEGVDMESAGSDAGEERSEVDSDEERFRNAGSFQEYMAAKDKKEKAQEDGEDEAPSLKKLKTDKEKASKKTKKPKRTAVASTGDASIDDLEQQALRLLAV